MIKATIAGHATLAEATGLDVFLCDRSSFWQRGADEIADGLLRQRWPRSTNFYTLKPTEIERFDLGSGEACFK